ncbi:hypothetical protein [Cryptosporidium parvum Iowa II]|uniref:Uncharacterized protein n=2 Tax=Cryptosporidium parvum TaxID=5807 RepID=Q5CQM2_CRYPI|nr:hypothetical protein [Cryptosporidium parvum Iowa II]EAK87697.1 hypothetical protein cgd4_170 [Cryptosporidium parvum Iowa II]QOY41905.1 Uncharacterized protein CPATCC_0017280 [Cryptosporidium parvum]WKS77208.1 hypothetical protein CPCDC_4g170 [Cryptosporidium sp. 43IA8]WRK32123.1 Uncharacterized protein cpbgf_400170 [Cryptosporidium parvum]|eukprot:QOY41905.1 hypothetical protein CPATCC_001491 [Cryptosporidium parvum]
MSTNQNIDIEKWQKEFFSVEKSSLPQEDTRINSSIKDERSLIEQKISEEIQTLELMNPDAFNRIPMIYEKKDPSYIEENWREYRGHLTQDYLKKSKQANRKLKKQNL